MLVTNQKLPSESGLSALTLIVFGLLIGVIAYVAYNVVPFFYYFYDLRSQFEQVIKVAGVDTDQEIRQKLMYFIKKYKIPCDDEDLRIERTDDTMTISLEYTEIFSIPWGDKEYEVRRFDFDATVTGTYRK